MKKFSTHNKVKLSNGTSISRATAEGLIRKAKQKKLDAFVLEHGYHYCEDCKRNDCTPIDCSHDISIRECFNSGKAELAWDVTNIKLRGRKCHRKHDGME